MRTASSRVSRSGRKVKSRYVEHEEDSDIDNSESDQEEINDDEDVLSQSDAESAGDDSASSNEIDINE